MVMLLRRAAGHAIASKRIEGIARLPNMPLTMRAHVS